MFAIQISNDNESKIRDRVQMNPGDRTLEMCIKSEKIWYIISGYVLSSGVVQDWAVLPQYVVERNYDYDDETIKTDWTQIFK